MARSVRHRWRFGSRRASLALAMYASRHAVFVGPGKLPGELREVLARRAHAPQPDIALQLPRLLALFESAADAERVASQVQRLKLGAVVAGPEQPPAEGSWAVARTLEFFDRQWRVSTPTSEVQDFKPGDVSAVTLVDWRPTEGPADRAVLLTLKEARPVFLRASELDRVSKHAVPVEGLRRLNEFLDALTLELPADLRVRSRRVSEADFRAAELTGDLVPLAVAVVDAVDTTPGELPRPLLGAKRGPHPLVPVTTALGAACAWGLYLVSLPMMVLALGYFTVAALSAGLLAGWIGLVMSAWATRRFMWSRWVARRNWGAQNPVPSWPISADEDGIKPGPLELSLDAVLLGSLALGAFQEGLVRSLSLWAFPALLLAAGASAAAAWDAWARE